MSFIWSLIANWLGATWGDSLSKDHREDPVYKKNVRELIERNKRFEESKE